jgi:2'-5' RNA ligase
VQVTPIRDYWNEILSSGDTVYAGLIFRIPPRLWRPLIAVQNRLKSIDPRQLYTNPATFHVPIKGLGYLEEELDRNKYETVLKKIKGIVSEYPPFEIQLKGVEAFPTAIYANVVDKGQFKEINERILLELEGMVEQSRFDADEFVPHVTLATFNTKDVEPLLNIIEEDDVRNREFGAAGVYEIEAVRVNLIFALGPQETQDNAFTYIRSFWLGTFESH